MRSKGGKPEHVPRAHGGGPAAAPVARGGLARLCWIVALVSVGFVPALAETTTTTTTAARTTSTISSTSSATATTSTSTTTTSLPYPAVRFILTVEAVSYTLLNAQAALLADFTGTILRVVAAVADVNTSDVNLVLRAGSVKVDATIVSNSSVAAASTQLRVANSTENLSSLVAESIGALPGIANVSTGNITVAMSPPALIIIPTTNTRTTTTRSSSTTTTSTVTETTTATATTTETTTLTSSTRTTSTSTGTRTSSKTSTTSTSSTSRSTTTTSTSRTTITTTTTTITFARVELNESDAAKVVGQMTVLMSHASSAVADPNMAAAMAAVIANTAGVPSDLVHVTLSLAPQRRLAPAADALAAVIVVYEIWLPPVGLTDDGVPSAAAVVAFLSTATAASMTSKVNRAMTFYVPGRYTVVVQSVGVAVGSAGSTSSQGLSSGGIAGIIIAMSAAVGGGVGLALAFARVRARRAAVKPEEEDAPTLGKIEAYKMSFDPSPSSMQQQVRGRVAWSGEQ